MGNRKVACRHCDGKGLISALVKYRKDPPCKVVTIPCRTCGGSGVLDPDPYRDARIEQGKAFRARRNALDMSMGELAKELHVSVVMVSDIEHGIEDPPKGWEEMFNAVEMAKVPMDENKP